MITPVILCFKWGTGYSCKYTNILFRALTATMSGPFRFVCMTDDATGLAEGIETIGFPPFAMAKSDWHKGMWPKVCAFAPGLFETGTPVLMMDVDVVIVKDIQPFFDTLARDGGLHIMREIPDTLPRLLPKLFGKPLLSNSSVVGFVAGTQSHLYEMAAHKSYDEIRSIGNDQNLIHRNATDMHHWPTGWVESFKKSLVFHFPVNLIRGVPRPTGYIVIFHGTPNPQDVIGANFKRWGTPEKFGFFPIKWVKSYWQTHARDTDT
ncbi:hypothetical protein [Yoonia sp. MH D7]